MHYPELVWNEGRTKAVKRESSEGSSVDSLSGHLGLLGEGVVQNVPDLGEISHRHVMCPGAGAVTPRGELTLPKRGHRSGP